MYTEERLRELSYGYNLDGGGYEFTDSTSDFPELAKIYAVILEGPDPDYFPWLYDLTVKHPQIYAFVPSLLGGVTWPQSFPHSDTECVLVGSGTVQETDRDCHCHGKLTEYTGAAGEPSDPISDEVLVRWLMEEPKLSHSVEYPQGTKFMWEFTGNSWNKRGGDQPLPLMP